MLANLCDIGHEFLLLCVIISIIKIVALDKFVVPCCVFS